MDKIKQTILKYQDEEKRKIEATRTIQNAWRNKRFSPSIGVIESKKTKRVFDIHFLRSFNKRFYKYTE